MCAEQYMVPLIERCPDVARWETAAIVLPADNPYGLPGGKYSFLESYCNLALSKCDCRRVFLNVVYEGRLAPDRAVLATIGYGWEDGAFYKAWVGGGDAVIDWVKGPVLEATGVRTKYSEAILAFFSDTLLKQQAFADKLAKHYHMFKAASPVSRRDRRGKKSRYRT